MSRRDDIFQEIKDIEAEINILFLKKKLIRIKFSLATYDDVKNDNPIFKLLIPKSLDELQSEIKKSGLDIKIWDQGLLDGKFMMFFLYLSNDDSKPIIAGKVLLYPEYSDNGMLYAYDIYKTEKYELVDDIFSVKIELENIIDQVVNAKTMCTYKVPVRYIKVIHNSNFDDL